MKRAWLLRKRREAVSPVIATILMVAITVVLAAVLYVMVSGLIGPTGGGGPQVAFLSSTATGNVNEYKLEVGSVSQAVLLANFQVAVLNRTTNAVAISSVTLASGTLGTGGGVTLVFTDLNTDGKVGGGDFFILQGVKGSNSYTINLLWKASGSRIISGNVPP